MTTLFEMIDKTASQSIEDGYVLPREAYDYADDRLTRHGVYPLSVFSDEALHLFHRENALNYLHMRRRRGELLDVEILPVEETKENKIKSNGLHVRTETFVQQSVKKTK
jgi:Zn-finger domain-containing protein